MKIDSNTQFKRMLETNIPKLITSLAVPTVISQMITTAYNTADTYFVAQIGTSAAAAVGVVFSLMSIIQAAGFGLAMGANSLISRYLGAKEDEKASKYGNSALLAAILFGFILMGGGLSSLKGLMRILGSTETILPYSCEYGKYILIGAPLMCSEFVLNNILRSEGEAVLAMWGLSAGGILNMLLDPLFISGFHMGIGGAAVATLVSQTVSFFILISFFIRKKSIIPIRIRDVSRDPADYFLIVKMGFPTICRQMLGSLSSVLMNVQAAAFGDAAVAAVTISNKIYMFVRNIVIGIGQGFQPVAGYNYGAKNNKRVREAFLFTCKAGTALCSLAAVFLAVYASSVITWFIGTDAEVVRIGSRALLFACGVMPFMAYSTYVNQMYQCLGFSKQATFLASCRQGICFVPLILILPVLFHLNGVIMSQPSSDFFTFVISVPFQITFFKFHLKIRSE
ncbi:Multidrug export protein MepA [Caprobacter fermentans]|uniref:Multidrug export protein MepA n=1 Tax=Caproicibacter fermentans TaxID=2576756 RepID=A0A6N8HYK6_9FIRM|nr:MATE family efflux transporter [Caproicibacter fermentans]MVB10842.1 Multidrug export protein MepA [Caproicibacter fermentans]OCN01376.1 MATE family efflux transporter [Clostridium sp. W14A]